MSSIPKELVEVIRLTGILCLNVDDPGWDDARGYLFHEPTGVLYFPVSKKYEPVSPADFRVLIRSTPPLLVIGDLYSATSDCDGDVQIALALERGTKREDAEYMLYDQRNRRPRKSRRKLVINDVSVRHK